VPKIGQCVTGHTGCRINYVATVIEINIRGEDLNTYGRAAGAEVSTGSDCLRETVAPDDNVQLDVDRDTYLEFGNDRNRYPWTKGTKLCDQLQGSLLRYSTRLRYL
jgi:hypothetical protein